MADQTARMAPITARLRGHIADFAARNGYTIERYTSPEHGTAWYARAIAWRDGQRYRLGTAGGRVFSDRAPLKAR